MSSKYKFIGIIIGLLAIVAIVLGYVDGFGEASIIIETNSISMFYGDTPHVSGFKVEELSPIFKRKSEITPTANMVTYDSEYIGTQEAVFTYKNNMETFNLTISPKELTAPIISCNQGVVDWSDNALVTKYIVNINNVEYETTASEYDLKVLSQITGEINVKVKAISPSNKYSNSAYSNELLLNKLLPTTSITYEAGKIKWTAVENANKYYVWINGTKCDSVTNEYKYSNFVTGANEIKVQAYGSNAYVSSNVFTGTLTKHSQVNNVRYENKQILWDSTNTNCSYEIDISGTKYTTDNNYYFIDFEFNTPYTVKVKAISKDNKYIDSDYSDNVEVEVVYNKLATPTAKISLGDYSNTYIINVSSVANANQYDVVVKLYSSDFIVSNNKYTLTTKLKKEITINATITKIEVTIIAKDANGVYEQSDSVTVERSI